MLMWIIVGVFGCCGWCICVSMNVGDVIGFLIFIVMVIFLVSIVFFVLSGLESIIMLLVYSCLFSWDFSVRVFLMCGSVVVLLFVSLVLVFGCLWIFLWFNGF